MDRDGGVIDMVSDFLPHLLELTTFVRQCERVAGCMLRQLHALFNLRGDGLQLVGARDLPMGRVWRTMGDLLSVLIGPNFFCIDFFIFTISNWFCQILFS